METSLFVFKKSRSGTFYTSYKGWKLPNRKTGAYNIQPFYTSYKGWKPYKSKIVIALIARFLYFL